jgi:hypothetical protein
VTGTNPSTLLINDNDRAGTLAFNASVLSVNESAGTLTVTVTRTGGNAGGIEVSYAATDGTAVNGVDYTLAPGTVTFGVNQMALTFTVGITNQPGTAQGNRVFTISLLPPMLPATLGPPSLLTVTILDMDPTLRFSSPGYSAPESGSATITVERLGSPAGVATVTLQTGDLFAPIGGAGQVAQTATAPQDYTSVNRVLTFAGGVRTVTTTVPIVADTTVEGNETINLRLTAPVNATIVNVTDGAAVLTLLDNDQGGEIQFGAPTYSVTEGTATATITITRTGGIGGPVTVDFETDDGVGTATAGALLTSPGADYVSVRRLASNLPANPVVFNAGVTSQTVTIPIVNDTLDEPVETVSLRLSNPSGGATLGARATALLNITDNDVAGAVQFTQPVYTVSEAALTAPIALSRAGGVASAVTVLFSTADPGGPAGAQAGVHYTTVTATATFAANQTTQTVNVPLAGENFIAAGSKLVNLALSHPGGGATLGLRTTAVLRIVDNEDTVQFAAPTFQIAEGGAGVVTVERTGTGGTIVVNVATSDGTGVAGTDYRTTTGNLTFTPGVLTRTISVPTITNTRDEGDRTVNLALTLVSGPAGAAVGAQAAAVLNIMDNDAGGQIRFRESGYTIKENNGFLTVTIIRAGGVAGPVTVDYTTVDGTGRAGVDYTQTQGTLTFPAGETLRQFIVPITPNNRDDGDKTFSIRLSNPTGGATVGTPGTVSATIREDDEGGIITFSAATFSATECATLPCQAVLTVTRAGGVAGNVQVDFATADGTATALSDYVATTGTLTFGYLQTGQTIRIPLQIEPGAQAIKTFSVILSNPRGGAILGALPAADVRITDTR